MYDRTTIRIFGWDIEDELLYLEHKMNSYHTSNIPLENKEVAVKIREQNKYQQFFRKSRLNRDNT